MSDSVRPHRQQPTRLPCPWDSPGKNTGVGCHFLLQCMKVKHESEVSVVSDSLRPDGLQPTRFLRPWDFPGKSTGVGCHRLLQHQPQVGLKPHTPSLSSAPGGSAGTESTCSAGDLGSIPGLGRCPGEGNGYPLQYSGLKNSVHGVAKSWTCLRDFHFP